MNIHRLPHALGLSSLENALVMEYEGCVTTDAK